MVRRTRSGAAAIEFVFWLPVLVVLFSGIVDVSWLMSRYHNVVRSARDGARVGVAIIEADTVSPPGSEIAAVARTHATAVLNGVGMTCDSRCTVTSAVVMLDGARVLQVDVAYDYQPIVGILPLDTTVMRSSFTMMVQQQ